MSTLDKAFSIFIKDIRQEWRTRFGVNTILAFIASSLFVVLFSMRADQLSAASQSGLLWIIILFACLTSLSRVFVSERERGTLDLLRLNASPIVVYSGKLLFSLGLTLFITFSTSFLFLWILQSSVYNPAFFFLVLLLGAAGLAGTTTLLSALVSQANRTSAIFPVITLPLLIPLLLILIRLTGYAFNPSPAESYLNDLLALIGFVGVTISASVVLIDTLWDD
ncbi:heme exporter protein CcmB [Balneolaceae bacterium ANBcel3]|nr:heme exporter protein CcmB [Balneolaceae bacterium ANBcel3]